MLEARFVPIEKWPGEAKPSWKQKRGIFRIGYAERLDLLESELRKLGARDTIIQCYFERRDLRNDGWPRSSARPGKPGIIISFRNRKGEELSFPCDTYVAWEDNLYAIALSLEALRSVDRYGVTQRAEQYAGWKRLPIPEHIKQHDRHWAIQHLAALAGVEAVALREQTAVELAYRVAAKKTHPDTGGNTDAFQMLQEAMRLLRAAA